MGDLECVYLKSYFECSESVIILILDDERVVGASTAIPVEFDMEKCQKPCFDHELNSIFYFDESVILPAYRHQGVYRQFFQLREQAAKDYGAEIATFCAIDRAPDDPRRPLDYKPLDDV